MFRTLSLTLLLLLAAPVEPQHGQPGPQPGGIGVAGGPGIGGGGSPAVPSALAEYTFNDTTDLGADSGGTYDLTPTNSPAPTGGANSYAFHNNGTDLTHAGAVDSATLSAAGGDFSVCAWVIPDVLDDDDVIAKKDNYSDQREWVLRMNISSPSLYRSRECDTYQNLADGPVLTVSDRNFVCATYDGTTRTSFVYVDAVPGNESAALTTDMCDGTDPFEVGGMSVAGGNKEGYTGAIGPVYWFKGTNLSSGDVTALYNSGDGYDCEGAIDLYSSMTRCWDMDEDPSGGAGAYKDEVSGGVSDNLTPSGGPTRVAGIVSRSDSGLGTSFVTASAQSYDLGAPLNGVRSIAFWVYATDASYDADFSGAIMSSNGTNDRAYDIFWTNTSGPGDALYFQFTQDADQTPNAAVSYTTLPVDQWVHIVAQNTPTGEGGDGKTRVYANGALVGTSTQVLASIKTTSTNFQIGNWAFGASTMILDEVSLYDEALTTDEITALYESFE